jgi:threonine/homoserine/homoserine lactone efflux protein
MQMSPLPAVVALVAIAAITPGPNNLIVLRVSARAGFAAAAPAITGIVLGGLALLGLVVVGGDALFTGEPRLRSAVALAGCLYLSWLGVRLIANAGQGGAPQTLPTVDLALPTGARGLFGFQLANPKAWVMAMSATSVPDLPMWQLVAVFAIVPGICLVGWSAFGVAVARSLARPRIATWFDRAMGMLLVASAVALGAP